MNLCSAVFWGILLVSVGLIPLPANSLKCYINKTSRMETCSDTSTPQYCSCHIRTWADEPFKSTGCTDEKPHNYDFSRGLDCSQTAPGSVIYVRACVWDEDLCCTQDALNNAKNVKIGSSVSVSPSQIPLILVMAASKVICEFGV